MTQSELIAQRLEEVLLNGKWVANTNFKEQIEQVSWEQAIQKIGSLNTIAVLTYHVNYYLGGILNVFLGGNLEIKDKYSFDMPPITSKGDWDKLITDFLSNSKKFISHVATMEDSLLGEYFVDEKYGSYQRNLEGIIEHSYYHLGQIVLLRKMV
ncbi:DUF1572 domain-containing protein [Muricauda sp. AC10]|nr:DUF1572 domain-containing protein [Muricauda sp. AC10]